MYRINFHLYKIAEMGVILMVHVHWVACLEYYLPLVVARIAGPDDESVRIDKTKTKRETRANRRDTTVTRNVLKLYRSWIRSAYMLKRKTRFRIYLACVHRALIALAGSAHYLDMRATEDIVYNLVLTILGFLGFIYLLGKHEHSLSLSLSLET